MYHTTLIQEITAGLQQFGTIKQVMVSQNSLGSNSGAISTSDLRRYSAPETTAPALQTVRYRSANTMAMNQFCGCMTRRKRSDRVGWDNLSMVTETSSSDHHTPECPLSKRPPAKSQTRRLRFSVPIVQSIWKSAARISLSLTTGAGGFNFGQRLTWVATVDSALSPTFRILELAMQAFDTSLPNGDLQGLLESCFRRLAWCYATRQASVTDVNERGQSMLERAAWRFFVSPYAGSH